MDPVSPRTRSRYATGAASASVSSSQSVPPVTQTETGGDVAGRGAGRLPKSVQALLVAARIGLTEGRSTVVSRIAPGAGAPWGAALADLLAQGVQGLPPEILELLQSSALEPGLTGERLRELLQAGGRTPAELLGGALRGEPSAGLLGSVEAQLLPRLEVAFGPTAVEVAALRGLLETALRHSVWSVRDQAGSRVTAQSLASLVGSFPSELSAVLGRTEGAQPWLNALTELGPGELLAGREGALVRALHAEAGPELRQSIQSLAQSALAGELSARLEDAAQASESTVQAERMRRLYNALEQERFGSDLRQRHDGGLSWSLPMADGALWAALALRMNERKPAAGATETGKRSYRVQLETDLSSLGPVRASILMGASRIAVRLEVERPETAQRMRTALGDLEAHLGAEGQRVVIAVVEKPSTNEAADGPSTASPGTTDVLTPIGKASDRAPRPGYFGPGVDVRG